MTTLLTPDELEAKLRDIGARRYHRLHPFHHLLHGGKCTKGQVQAWALNRYYYQAMIPVKDASLIARCLDADIRREWRSRLVDHDGTAAGEGGIARWLKLTDGLGLDRDYVTSLRGLLPATRFAVEAYVHFVAEKTLLEAIASSLTELFSPAIIGERIEGMLKNYDFITAETHGVFLRPAAPGAARQRVRAGLRQAERQDAGAAGAGAQGARIQVRRAVGDAGRALPMPMCRPSTSRPAPSCRRSDCYPSPSPASAGQASGRVDARSAAGWGTASTIVPVTCPTPALPEDGEGEEDEETPT